MKSGKPPKLTRKTVASLVRSPAAEYQTFVTASGQGGVEAVYADESIWKGLERNATSTEQRQMLDELQ